MAEVRELLGERAGAPMNSRREKFVRLAEKRTMNAIKAIRVIGKLGNHAHYEYDERDVKKIASALSKEIEALKVRMTMPGSQETINFKL